MSSHIKQLQYSWASEADADSFAKQLAQAPQIEQAIVELRGDLGAGKTTLVRYLLRALGVTGRIKSPTYTIVEPYRTRTGALVHHFDFYRFEDPNEWIDAGLRDLYAGSGLKLAEWPEQAEGVLPEPDLRISIDVSAHQRRSVIVQASTVRGRALLEVLEQNNHD